MVMPTLFLLRHAKSSWDDPDLADFDRPLARRGRKDAPLIGAVNLLLDGSEKIGEIVAGLMSRPLKREN